MQEFLTNDTVNCNLMSLTGYRTLVIMQSLIESPKTIDEINEILFNNKYIKEKFSFDTLRIYINSLRAVGCNITRANKSSDMKYKLISHPFAYDLTVHQLKAIQKFYKSIYDKISLSEVILLEDFFIKLSTLVQNEQTREFLRGISVLKGINRQILDNLLLHCKKKNQITFSYSSPHSGQKDIEVVADKLSFKSGKLYFWGTNLTHGQYSYFSLEKILNIRYIKIRHEEGEVAPLKVVYELFNTNAAILDYERVIERNGKKLVVEAVLKSEFDLTQRVLYHGSECKVISPLEFRDKIVSKLKSMEACYDKV